MRLDFEHSGGQGSPAQPVRLTPAAPATVGPRFAVGYTIAQIGAYLSFMPLLSILTPLKAQMIDPAQKTTILGQVAFCGAVVASLANLAAGALSDRTASRFGRRRPWILGGLAGVLVSYYAILRAHDAMGLLGGLMLFQLAFNGLFAALLAVMPDRVPDRQKGVIAALISLGPPLGAVSGALLTGVVLQGEDARFFAIGAVLLITVAPFGLLMRDPPLAGPVRRADQGAGDALPSQPPPPPSARLDFACAWTSRFLVQIGVVLTMSFMLFYLQDVTRFSQRFPGRSAEAGVALLTVVWTVFNMAGALAGGLLSDRLARRKPFILAAGLIMAGGMAIFALDPAWPGPIIGQAIFGLGFGIYTAVETALITQVLPSRRTAGASLGVFNLANTLPQALAPLLAIGLLGQGHDRYPALFLAAAALAVTGAVAVRPIRGVH